MANSEQFEIDPNQLALFSPATTPLDEESDVVIGQPAGWVVGSAIGWDELVDTFGWTPQQFNQTEETMSPAVDE